MEKETWKVFYVGPRVKYEASNKGRIRRNGRIINIGIKNGYYFCRHQYVHRIIAQLFIPNPENKPCVDHIDTNPLNNKVTNLRWVTPSENALNPITRQHKSIAAKAIQKEIQNRPEVKAKRNAAIKETMSRPESKAKRSAALKGKQKSPEHRAKLSAAHSRPETKAKLSAALRASWAKRKQNKK